jgi:hypothetical protein
LEKGPFGDLFYLLTKLPPKILISNFKAMKITAFLLFLSLNIPLFSQETTDPVPAKKEN